MRREPNKLAYQAPTAEVFDLPTCLSLLTSVSFDVKGTFEDIDFGDDEESYDSLH